MKKDKRCDMRRGCAMCDKEGNVPIKKKKELKKGPSPRWEYF
jgi:hypothetical protein